MTWTKTVCEHIGGSMVYYTGDIHGSCDKLMQFCKKMKLTSDDIVVLLGDVGANYYGGKRDQKLKEEMHSMAPTFLCVHGNHEIRPSNLPAYEQKEWNGGIVWYEDEYPNLLFARDGEIFLMDGLQHLVIGGAYSVDKYYRLLRNYGWWPDEQPSDEIKSYVEEQIAARKIDIVLSHTCPFKYEPTEVFLPFIDQNTVDASTEYWLDKIEESVDYMAWFCGHWHVNKRIDKMHFLFNEFESSSQFDKGSLVEI